MSSIQSWMMVALMFAIGGALGVAIMEYDRLRRADEEEGR